MKTQTVLRAVITAGVSTALLVTACGTTPHRHGFAANDAVPATFVTPAASPSSSAPQPGHPAATGAAPHNAAPTPAYPQYMQGTQPAPIQVHLTYACVRQGGPEQLTVRTNPGFDVSYNVQYSDGSNGRTNGGLGYGATPPSGVYQGAWVVAPTAPVGTATVYVAVSGGGHPIETAFRQATFQVGSC